MGNATCKLSEQTNFFPLAHPTSLDLTMPSLVAPNFSGEEPEYKAGNALAAAAVVCTVAS